MSTANDLKREEIVQKAVEIIKNSPGIRSGELVEKLRNFFPDVNKIYQIIVHLDEELPNEIYKPGKGIFKHITSLDQTEQQETKQEINEDDFYQSFANWLMEKEECTKAIRLGGKRFRDKWGTPDVIGINEAPVKYILKHEPEIISAEIKLNTNDPITAFGQACAYKLFSHKTYLVIPQSSLPEDIDKIEALCFMLGIGFILFDSTNKENPNYQIKLRAYKHEPEMYYVNEFMKRDKQVEDALFG